MGILLRFSCTKGVINAGVLKDYTSEQTSSGIMDIPSEIIYNMPAVDHDSAASHEKHKLTQPSLDIRPTSGMQLLS